MLKPQRRPTHPGEILREHYLIPRGLSVADLARAVNHSYKHMSQVVNGKTAIEAQLAWKLALVFDTTPEFWLNLQNSLDLWEAQQSLAEWQPTKIYPAHQEVRA
jgi:addiction module HigA family antidote